MSDACSNVIGHINIDMMLDCLALIDCADLGLAPD